MNCPNLKSNDSYRCVTIDDSYRPSQYQLREYCQDERHNICPFFVGFMKRRLLDSPDEDGKLSSPSQC